MSYLLRMSDEIHDWLADLHASNPSAARLVGAALIALLGEGADLGPPLVTSLADPPRPEDFPEALDKSYQRRLNRLQIMRRRVAEAAMLAKDVQLQIAELDSLQATLGDQRQRAVQASANDLAAEAERELAAAHDQAAELRRMLPGLIEAERTLTGTSQHAQVRVDAFRIRKEALKASYTAARAERAVYEAIGAMGPDAGDDGAQDEDPGAPIDAAENRLREISDEIERELRAELSAEEGDLGPAPGLMELRLGDGDVRILFAVEPPGAALLIAVLEDRAAVRDHHDEAVLLSSDLLRSVRAGQDPEAAARGYDDTTSFLGEFFPGNADDVTTDAATLVARNRARSLAQQRVRRGVTQQQVAERMGVSEERVSAIERAEPGAIEVSALADYVGALGGRLEIIADFGTERVVLR